MKIGIDASNIHLAQKTGTEHYAYQMITGLLSSLDDSYEIILYTREPISPDILSLHSKVREHRIVWKGYGWTLCGLSLALFNDKPDVFYTPASILPLWCPRKSIPVIHGLEYEAFPQAYSFFRFWHLATFTLVSAKRAHMVIVPSQSTKDDLVSEYNIDESKITVVHSGFSRSTLPDESDSAGKVEIEQPFLLWIGRKELRKNLSLVVDVFDLIKPENPNLRLLLVGGEGYGYRDIHQRIQKSPYVDDILEVGYISDQEKWRLLQKSKIVLFPSWYEGFGYPVLEAFSAEVPVITSDSSSLPEIVGDAAQTLPLEGDGYLDDWKRAVTSILDNPEESRVWVEKGRERLKEFSLERTITQTKEILTH